MSQDASLLRRGEIAADFTLAERLLAALSKDPAAISSVGHYSEPTTQWDLDTALSELRSAFPHFDALIRNKRVLDYGCGDGFQSVAMAREGAAAVMGVDISPQRLEHGKRLAGDAANVSFGTRAQGCFDVAISLNSFEHFPEPERDLQALADSIVPGGQILITFGSPWLSPYGSHMNFFTTFPWVNIVFSEKTVFRVRSLYRNDGSTSYVPDMNKMTVRRFERIIAASGLKKAYWNYKAIKRLPLTRIPILRELFINRISCVLTK